MNQELYDYLEHLQLSMGVSQILEEFVPLLEFIQERNPKNLVEIGSSSGFSMMGFSKVVSGKKISIDLPDGLFGGQSLQGIEARNSYWQTYIKDIFMIVGNSQDPQVIKCAADILGEEKTDVLFIDGDHRYEGVKADYENYKSMVNKGGIIIFHDINVHPAPTESWQLPVGVNQLWNELQGEKIEFNTHQNWAGIGVIKV